MKINISKYFKSNKNQNVHAAEGFFVLSDDTDFNIVESYKTARTNIMFSLPKTEDGKVILLTSSEPGEGKTTASINLAYTFSQTDAKVIIVDCDLRKPRVHRYLKIDKSIGVSNILCGFNTLDEAIQKNVKGSLDCITVGEIPINSAELLMSEEFGKLIDELKSRYDYVFIDTPPILTVTDAQIIAPMVSGVLVVVKQGVSTYDVLDKTVEMLKTQDVKLLGFLVNSVERTSKAKYYSKKYNYFRKGYLYQYSHEYGDKYEIES